tara:strand:- start:8672 stop:9430 length:759 start_codon:yes stop_codon:yes gene_type:complete
MSKINYIFITGFGRSGTTFLSHLLSQCIDFRAFHEYVGNREFELLSWYLGTSYSKPYLENQKVRIEQDPQIGNKFIDVNGAYRNCVDEVEEVFKPLKTFHLVRDPRNVVRSLYTRRDDKKIHFIPKNETDIKWWLTANKFSQICWNWKTETELLLEKKLDIIHFEKITGDFNYFKSNLLDKIDLKMDLETWQKEVAVKRNKTKPKLYRYLYAKIKGKQFVETRLPTFNDWPEDYKAIFKDICGDTMLKLGYE